MKNVYNYLKVILQLKLIFLFTIYFIIKGNVLYYIHCITYIYNLFHNSAIFFLIQLSAVGGKTEAYLCPVLSGKVRRVEKDDIFLNIVIEKGRESGFSQVVFYH